MTSIDFCYWLQGLLELSDIKELDNSQRQIIHKHLNMVMYYEEEPNDFCKSLKDYLISNKELGVYSYSLLTIKQNILKYITLN